VISIDLDCPARIQCENGRSSKEISYDKINRVNNMVVERGNDIFHFRRKDLLVAAVESDQPIISSDFLITNNCYLSPDNKAIDNAYIGY